MALPDRPAQMVLMALTVLTVILALRDRLVQMVLTVLLVQLDPQDHRAMVFKIRHLRHLPTHKSMVMV